MLALTTSAPMCSRASRWSSRATQPLPRTRPYSADRLSPTTRILRVAATAPNEGIASSAAAAARPRLQSASQRRRVALSSRSSTTFMSEPIIAVERLTKRVQDSTGTLTILHEIDFTLPPQRSVAIVGASGVGQEHVALAHRRARHADHRDGAARRHRSLRPRRGRARRGARRQGRLRVPELPAARQPQRARERDAAARAPGPRRCQGAGHRDAAARRPERAAAPLPARAVGRRAAARRAGARLRRPADAAAGRRADRQPRLRDRRDGDGADARAQPRGRHDAGPGDARPGAGRALRSPAADRGRARQRRRPGCSADQASSRTCSRSSPWRAARRGRRSPSAASGAA